MKFFFIVFLLSIALGYSSNSQLGINTDGGMPHVSAMLDVRSYSKGMLIPRMTAAQKYAVTTPAHTQ